MARRQDLRARVEGLLDEEGAAAWGVADLAGLVPAKLGNYPRAVSLALAMDPAVMASIRQGPNQTYTELYEATNQRLDRLCGRLQALLANAGHGAWAVPSSVRSDPVNIRGDFPHKTAATRAGLGWVGELPAHPPPPGALAAPGHGLDRRAPGAGPAGGEKLLRNLSRVRGGLSGRGSEGRGLAARPGPGGNTGPGGLRRLQEGPLLSLSPGPHLRHL